jgi:hypothetical protein
MKSLFGSLARVDASIDREMSTVYRNVMMFSLIADNIWLTSWVSGLCRDSAL